MQADDFYDGTDFLGFCPTHNGIRPNKDWRDVGCQHDICVKLRELPANTNGPYWNLERFKQMNQLGQTEREVRDEIYESAREDGRDIQRAR